MQARLPQSTLRTETGLRCSAWQGVATHNHTKKVSLYKTLPRSTAGLRHICMIKKGVLARRRAGGKHTSKAAPCSAHSPGRRDPAFRMPVAQMQAAPRSSAKKLATEITGAKALERARRGGCCREERKAACRRHGEPAQARPRPHRLEGGAARRAREERGVALNIASWRQSIGWHYFTMERLCSYEAPTIRKSTGTYEKASSSRRRSTSTCAFMLPMD